MNEVLEFIKRAYPAKHDPMSGEKMSKLQLDLLTRQLWKKFLSAEGADESGCKFVLRWLLYLDTLGTPVIQRAACRWLCRGAVMLPEDEYKVKEAVKIAKLNHVDPLSYDSPMEIINSFKRTKKADPALDPSTVPTLHLRFIDGNGLEVYDVDEDQVSRENLRRIINTHWGVNCNPWCLLQGDRMGNLMEDSETYWRYYSAYPKRVAFINGKLHAFSAGSTRTRTWWDRFNQPSEGSKEEVLPVPGDKLGRMARYEVDSFTGEKEFLGGLFKGNPENGLFQRYRSLKDETPYYCTYRLGGKRISDQWPGLTHDMERCIGDISLLEEGALRIPDAIRCLPSVPLLKNPFLKELYLSDGISSIEEAAFTHNKGLLKIRMPESMPSIPKGLFVGCSSLTLVSLPSDLKILPRNTFYGCMSLRTLSLPSEVTIIGEWAFSGCSSLTEVRLPNRILTIPEGLFYGCRSLKAVKLPRVKEIEPYAFRGCANLESIVIPNSVKTIGVGAFEGCTSLKEVVLPSGLTCIPSSLFKGCTSLMRIIIPSRVNRIDASAFQGCESLEYVSFPESLKDISKEAFQGCKSLTEINLPSGTEYIGNAAFSGCFSLKEVLIPQSVIHADAGSFSLCPGITFFLVSSRLYSRFYERFGHRVEKVA